MAKILIVEDNALNIKLFCDLLAAHGHEPEAVTDSRIALDAARNFSPDLVITDIQLPHVSGLDLIRLIREDEELARIPIMAVTAYSAQRGRRADSRGRRAGLCVEADLSGAIRGDSRAIAREQPRCPSRCGARQFYERIHRWSRTGEAGGEES